MSVSLEVLGGEGALSFGHGCSCSSCSDGCDVCASVSVMKMVASWFDELGADCADRLSTGEHCSGRSGGTIYAERMSMGSFSWRVPVPELLVAWGLDGKLIGCLMVLFSLPAIVGTVVVVFKSRDFKAIEAIEALIYAR